MTTIALSQLVDRVPAFLSRLGHSFSELLRGIDEAREMAHRFKILSQMTDGQLAARGLKREDIPQAVLSSRRGV
jgi:uncharacterized protein YjiS (DUF1127 family)